VDDAADDRATAPSAQVRVKNIGTWTGEGLVIGRKKG
jgi:hypothetical protein